MQYRRGMKPGLIAIRKRVMRSDTGRTHEQGYWVRPEDIRAVVSSRGYEAAVQAMGGRADLVYPTEHSWVRHSFEDGALMVRGAAARLAGLDPTADAARLSARRYPADAQTTGIPRPWTRDDLLRAHAYTRQRVAGDGPLDIRKAEAIDDEFYRRVTRQPPDPAFATFLLHDDTAEIFQAGADDAELVRQIQAMSAVAQAHFDPVTTLYRGVGGAALESARQPDGSYVFNMDQITSFTDSRDVAESYARKWGEGHGVVISFDVPRRSILMSHREIARWRSHGNDEVVVSTGGRVHVPAEQVHFVD